MRKGEQNILLDSIRGWYMKAQRESESSQSQSGRTRRHGTVLGRTKKRNLRKNK